MDSRLPHGAEQLCASCSKITEVLGVCWAILGEDKGREQK